MGLIGIVIAGLVNMFLVSSGLQFAISVIGVLVFTGLAAFDTQRMKEIYIAGDDEVIAGKKAIMGALALYLDFLNLFLMLLQFFGDRAAAREARTPVIKHGHKVLVIRPDLRRGQGGTIKCIAEHLSLS